MIVFQHILVSLGNSTSWYCFSMLCCPLPYTLIWFSFWFLYISNALNGHCKVVVIILLVLLYHMHKTFSFCITFNENIITKNGRTTWQMLSRKQRLLFIDAKLSILAMKIQIAIYTAASALSHVCMDTHVLLALYIVRSW